jgi:hypothetical protein
MAVKTWRVVVEGSVRETYLVRAESAREAMEDWVHQGKPVSSEVADAEAVSAVLDEPEEICGETFDHDLREISEGIYECRKCGAEIFEEAS